MRFTGSKPIPSLERQSKVQIRHLSELPKFLGLVLPFILYGPIKVLHQVYSLLYVLLVQLGHSPEFILVQVRCLACLMSHHPLTHLNQQNPPTIPTLAIIWLVGKMTGSKVIIDWHNLGYSILALRLGNEHPFVKVATWCGIFLVVRPLQRI